MYLLCEMRSARLGHCDKSHMPMTWQLKQEERWARTAPSSKTLGRFFTQIP